ncbi:unnamed protein product [Allacma fusca]|uniref:Uncharacterized protein n=1 Tax=Allacma fusca TaxID=39272 RepID=A0A8J2KW29_9HEXA|nr:unnamed protein product [Allacma fusca]
MIVKVTVVWIVWWGMCVWGLEETAGMEEVKQSIAPWNLWSVYSTVPGSGVTFPRPSTPTPIPNGGLLRAFPTSAEVMGEETEEEEEEEPEENSYEDNEVSSWLDPQPTSKVSPPQQARERTDVVRKGEKSPEEIHNREKSIVREGGSGSVQQNDNSDGNNIKEGTPSSEVKEGKRKRDEEHPAIASIRHHKSRKNFVRARKGKDKAPTAATTSSILSLLLNGEQGDEPVHETVPDRKNPSPMHPGLSTEFPISSDKAPLRLLRQHTPTSSSPELGKMSSSNDTSIVYGRPYFTPSRKHNSTRMQRIKDLLSNASSPQLGVPHKERAAGQTDKEEESAVTVSVHSKSSRHPTNSPGPKNPKTFLLDPHTLLPPVSSSSTTRGPSTRPPHSKSSRRKSKVRSSTPLPTSTDPFASSSSSSFSSSSFQSGLEGISGEKVNLKTTLSTLKPTIPAPSNLMEPLHTSEGHHFNLPNFQEGSNYPDGLSYPSGSNYLGVSKYPEGSVYHDGSNFNKGSNYHAGLNHQKGPKEAEDSSAKMSRKELGEVETEEIFPYTGGDEGENKSRPPGELFSDYTMLGGDDDKFIHSPFESNVDTMEEEVEEDASLLPSSTTSSAASKTKPDIDIVTKFLRIVETQHTLGDNCTAGTAFSLGEGVVDRYAQERFRLEANVAVNRANMLTRLWKYAEPPVLESEYLLHANLFSMIEFDDDIFAAGNCYDKLQYKNYTLFCPFAYRLPEGNILVKDLAVEYKYLSNTSEWFFIARNNAERVIKNYNQFSRGIVKGFGMIELEFCVDVICVRRLCVKILEAFGEKALSQSRLIPSYLTHTLPATSQLHLCVRCTSELRVPKPGTSFMVDLYGSHWEFLIPTSILHLGLAYRQRNTRVLVSFTNLP